MITSKGATSSFPARYRALILCKTRKRPAMQAERFLLFRKGLAVSIARQ
jgi:hypothetical protein